MSRVPILEMEEEEVVFILDWDDTLFASYAKDQIPVDSVGWRRLAFWVGSLLQYALKLAPKGVYIVTNSQTGWVELSITKYMPSLEPFLARVPVISARSTYSTAEDDQKKFTEEDLVRWKSKAFSDIIQRHKAFAPLTFVLMGDTLVEIKALEQVNPDKVHNKTKWIKFTYAPSLATLVGQIQYVCSLLPYLLWDPHSFHITLNPQIFSDTPKSDPYRPPNPIDTPS